MSKENYIVQISREIKLAPKQVAETVNLLEGGATIPFIARYRKEVTGSLDEVQVASIRDRFKQLREVDARREGILESMDKLGRLTDELKQKLMDAQTVVELEDIYLPFRPKRRTRSMIAREKGLEPLAEMILAQDPKMEPMGAAAAFVNADKEVNSPEEALVGARDIIAEWVSEHQAARARLRELYFTQGKFVSKVIRGRDQEGAKYQDYFDWQEPVASAPSHRILAMRRGEKEEFLILKITVPPEEVTRILEEIFVKGNSKAGEQVKLAIEDGFKRLLSMSMETEIRLATKERADKEAIRVFAENLRQLLIAPALGQKIVLAIDPGFRTGCKVVVLDRQGKLWANDTIYPNQSEQATIQAGHKIRELCKQYKVEFIAIGNGTAGRETEIFIRALKIPDVQIVMVNESGASIYSASEVAREEFPDHDVTVRGAVSIGRRLMDPLAELVKIDPKSIGVGQYQHDVDQIWLKESLDDVVVSCVNLVGVELNTASKELLTYVSGVGPVLAKTMVDLRNEQGSFHSRHELKNIPRMGAKAFEQAAGFLRIRNAENPLDSSAVHPESYPVVEAMAKDVGCTVQDLIHEEKFRQKIDLKKYVTDTVGLPTLTDIQKELAKPGRDPRQQFEVFQFSGALKPEDLRPGMKLPGIVTNITKFGAFVDVGVHLDGLVHVSEMANRFVEDPAQIVKVNQKVMVTVVDVDLERKRIALSMKPAGQNPRH